MAPGGYRWAATFNSHPQRERTAARADLHRARYRLPTGRPSTSSDLNPSWPERAISDDHN
jgi:hypothetical protein